MNAPIETTQAPKDPQTEQLLDELMKVCQQVDNISRLIFVAQELAHQLSFPSTGNEDVDQAASTRHRDLNKNLEAAWWDNNWIRWTYQKFAEQHGQKIE